MLLVLAPPFFCFLLLVNLNGFGFGFGFGLRFLKQGGKAGEGELLGEGKGGGNSVYAIYGLVSCFRISLHWFERLVWRATTLKGGVSTIAVGEG